MAMVAFTAAERAAGPTHPAVTHKLARAAAALAVDGIVVLGGAVEPGLLAALDARMQADLNRAAELGWELDDNWQGIRPPLDRPHLHEGIIFNGLVLAVSATALGPGQRLSGYQANTAFAAGSAVAHAHSPNLAYRQPGRTQRPHVDQANPRPAPAPPARCTFLVANIPTADVDEANGATRFWRGSQLDCQVSAITRTSHSHAPERYGFEVIIRSWTASSRARPGSRRTRCCARGRAWGSARARGAGTRCSGTCGSGTAGWPTAAAATASCWR
jgi:hypothetical protein